MELTVSGVRINREVLYLETRDTYGLRNSKESAAVEGPCGLDFEECIGVQIFERKS